MLNERAYLVERDGQLYIKSIGVWYDGSVEETLWWPTGITYQALVKTSISEEAARALLGTPVYRQKVGGPYYDEGA